MSKQINCHTVMSSFSGEIPLPPDPSSNGGTARVSQPFNQSHVMPGYPGNPVVGAAGSQAYPYDAQTMAYYQAYYAQMAAAGYSYPTTGYPVAPGVTPYYTPGVAPVTTASNAPSSLHPLLQHQATGTSNSTGSSSTTGQKNNQAFGKKQERQLPEVEEEDDDPTVDRGQGTHNKKNILACHGNEKTMNLNNLLLTNIQQSQYFKTTLYGLKSVNELLDEIWYNVKHMEPWESGSRKVCVFNTCFVNDSNGFYSSVHRLEARRVCVLLSEELELEELFPLPSVFYTNCSH